MPRLEQLINEIQGLKNEETHRSSLRILNLLENNRALFIQALDPDDFKMAVKNFQALCDTPSRYYGTPEYTREYRERYNNLLFYLNRIVL